MLDSSNSSGEGGWPSSGGEWWQSQGDWAEVRAGLIREERPSHTQKHLRSQRWILFSIAHGTTLNTLGNLGGWKIKSEITWNPSVDNSSNQKLFRWQWDLEMCNIANGGRILLKLPGKLSSCLYSGAGCTCLALPITAYLPSTLTFTCCTCSWAPVKSPTALTRWAQKWVGYG